MSIAARLEWPAEWQDEWKSCLEQSYVNALIVDDEVVLSSLPALMRQVGIDVEIVAYNAGMEPVEYEPIILERSKKKGGKKKSTSPEDVIAGGDKAAVPKKKGGGRRKKTLGIDDMFGGAS